MGQGAGLDNLWDIATQKCRNTMPCTAELRSDKSPILPCSGVLTRKELIDVKRRLVTDQNRELRYVIGDLTPVTDIHISAPEFRAIVDEDRRLAAIAQRNLSTILRHPAALISEHFPDSPSSKQADLSRLPSAAAGVWDRPERSVRGCGHTPLVESPVVVG